MPASNSASTIFKCISCSFGTHDQAAYAEHIKCCSNESTSEPGPSDFCDNVRKNLSGTVSKYCTYVTQTTSCVENEINISDAELHPVKFSRSIGLQFLGKQHPDIGCDAFICQLCGFTGVLAESSTRQATDDTSMTDIRYRCDDCSYSTHKKRYFYNHCAHHQFDGPSKYPHCSYCALTDTVVMKHILKYHDSQHLGDLNTNVSVDKPTDICTRTSSPQKAAKRSENSPCKTVYALRYKEKKWFTCQNCRYK